MGKITRCEFLGNRLWFSLLCISVIGLPIAVLYLLDTTVVVEEKIEDPTAFLEAFRAGNVGSSKR